jgi:hypothetical protein
MRKHPAWRFSDLGHRPAEVPWKRDAAFVAERVVMAFEAAGNFAGAADPRSAE